MNRPIRLLAGIVTVALAGGSAAALASAPVDREVAVDERETRAAYEEVDSIPALTRPYSFKVLDRDTLILWRTRRDPYLVELRHPSPELRFAWRLGVSSWGGRIHARFDDVHVDGLRYPIDKIYKLDREEAKRLTDAG